MMNPVRPSERTIAERSNGVKVDPGSLAQAKNYAYRLLAYRERSAGEIQDKLTGKGFKKGLSAKVVADFKKLGYLDDRRFAKAFLESRIKYRPSGLALIRSKLRSLGIADDTAESAISDAGKNYDEYAAAYSIAKNRASRFNKVDPIKAKRRIYDYLLRRRFKRDIIFKVLNEIYDFRRNQD